MFENPEITHDDLPQADSVTWLGMDDKFVRRLLTEAALILVFVSIGIGVLPIVFNIAFADDNVNISLGWLWLLVPVAAVPFFAWPLISVPRRGYAIRDLDIIYKSGVFWRTVTAIPFNRIISPRPITPATPACAPSNAETTTSLSIFSPNF